MILSPTMGKFSISKLIVILDIELDKLHFGGFILMFTVYGVELNLVLSLS